MLDIVDVETRRGKPARHRGIIEAEADMRIGGAQFVPVVGEVLADLATTGSTAHPIELFDPRRRFAGSAS